jgi:signal transduction histidine kinase
MIRNGASWRSALLEGRRQSIEHGMGMLFLGWLVVAALHNEALIPVVMLLPVATLYLASNRLTRLAAQSVALRHAEEQLRVRKEFLQVAAHELRTPITSLRGYADFVSRKVRNGEQLPPETLDRALTTIESQAGKLSRLINHLLDFARLEESKLALQCEQVDLSTLVAGVIEEVRSVSGDVEFVFRSPRRLDARVDSLRIEQVIVNLLTNAVKFSPLNRPVEVALQRDSGSIVLEVRDHGPGVPEENREAIFGLFQQAHFEDTVVGGLGVGLYVSRQIVEAHGGTIRVIGADGGGSRFIVRLPIDVAPTAPAATSETSTASV